MNNSIQQQIKSDPKDIEGTNRIFVKADKLDNLYKMSPNNYKQMFHREIIKSHF